MTIDVLDIPSSSDDAVDRFNLDLRLSRAESCVLLRGRLDATAADELTAVLARLDALPRAVVRIDALNVTAIEPDGAHPLLQAARRRSGAGAAPLIWGPVSDAVDRHLTELGLTVGYRDAGSKDDPAGVGDPADAAGRGDPADLADPAAADGRG